MLYVDAWLWFLTNYCLRMYGMSDIFLSYKSEDKIKAQIIAEALESEGYSVWWDRVIPPGRTYDEVIEEELDAAKCVVVLWSKESVKSDWVRTEASEGKIRRILVPVLIEDVLPPLAFRLIEAAKLIDWDGTKPNHEFDLLSKSVSRILGRTTAQKKKIQKPGEQEKGVKREKEKEKIISNSIGMKFVLIPAGEFEMGSPPDEEGRYDDEGPVHHVKISKPFYLGIYPVTQMEWKAVMGNNPSYFKGDNLPVGNVSWDDVQKFIKKLNEKDNTNKYRLPSEAEWEYAARAGTKTRYSFGDDESKLGEYAWYAENSGSRPPKKGDFYGYDQKDWSENKWSGKTHPVGQKEPNKWGLYDMHGNVWEWVQDTYHDSYKGAPIDGSAWEAGVGSARVFRGGGWLNYARGCRSASRFYYDPDRRGGDLGFRLLREL
jgi:formylglycine-generating enzyme required for sulfatase activity